MCLALPLPTLPPPRTCTCAAPPLQERLVREKRGRAERLYKKRGPGPAELSLQQLKHMAAVVSLHPLMSNSE